MANHLVSGRLQGSFKISLENAQGRVVRGLEEPVRQRLEDLNLRVAEDRQVLSVCGVSMLREDGSVEGAVLTGFGKLDVAEMGIRKIWPDANQEVARNMKVVFDLQMEDFTFSGKSLSCLYEKSCSSFVFSFMIGSRPHKGTSDWIEMISSNVIHLKEGENKLTPHQWGADHPNLKGCVRLNIAPATTEKVFVQVSFVLDLPRERQHF